MGNESTPCFGWPFLKNAVFLLIFGFIGLPGNAEEKPARPFFTWDLLWAGSWNRSFSVPENGVSPELIFPGGTLTNRGELRLGLPRQNLDFRVQGIDKRLIPGDGTFVPGFGLYFDGAGPGGKVLGNSRLLYGVMDDYGLSSRIHNIWAKSPPYAEYRRPLMRDLKTGASGQEPEAYLYLGLPQWGFFTGFASVQVDGEFNPAFGSGFEIRTDGGMNLRLEGFFTRKVLESRESAAWFSSAPPLPERDFRLFGLGAGLDANCFGLAGDIALSETFAWGRGLYGNAALRVGGKPWKFSLSLDAATNRYAGPDGDDPGQGFRMAARLERQWARSGLFRFNAVFRSPLLGEVFNRSSAVLYFRPSVPRGKQVPLFRFTRASLTLGRNALNPEKTQDSLEILGGFHFLTLGAVFTGSLHGKTAFGSRDNPFPLPVPPCFEYLESLKLGAELRWGIKAFTLRFKTGCMIGEDDPVWDFSLSGSLSAGKLGRVSLKIASPGFPDKWAYALSWRLAMISRKSR